MNIEINDILKLKNISPRKLSQMDDFKGVSTDSRNVKEGEIFFAIKGDNYDGHDFVDLALSKGAALAIVNKRWFQKNIRKHTSDPLLIVPDTIKALGELAYIYRRKFKKLIIALAGSDGKTTTKEMIYSILSKKYNVLHTRGNLNNHIGVPKMIFRLNENYDLAVIELGTNHFGEIKYLSEILDPDYGLITNIGRAHLEFFKNLDGVRKAKGELFEYLAHSDKFGLINGDDQNVVKASKKLKNKKFYGFTDDFDYSGKFLGTDKDLHNKMSVHYNNGKNIILKLKILGQHNLINALAATAVGLEFNVKPGDIQNALINFNPTDKRMELKEVNGMTILNDCYNSNPDSLKAALETMKNLPAKNKKIIVLGDMLEIGKEKRMEHENVAVLIKKLGFEYTFLYGPLSYYTYKTIANKIDYCKHYDDKDTLFKDLIKMVQPGDLILVKGSRGMKMETIIEKLYSQ